MEKIGKYAKWACMRGFRLDKIQFDPLHVLCLGLLQWALGYCFKDLLLKNFWRGSTLGPWEARYSQQLRNATRQFRLWAHRNRLEHSELRFTLAKLSISALSGDTATAYYKGKGHNTLVVSIWMSELCSRVASLPGHTEHDTACAACMWGYTQCLAICKRASLVLSDADVTGLEECRSAALRGQLHLWLEGQTRAPSENQWPMKPTHHFFDHMIRNAIRSRINFGQFACWADEHFIGHICEIAAEVGVSNRTALATMYGYLVDLMSARS